ncbi:vacuolar ATPase assembly integral membrane protein vma21, partial [Morone saxatilis]|uniref:vacuolar ATPase assembly integral membrane protein vma21 n=1 Tax=Morone saxatilis TaxID=34816 RepID=UPI0015E23A8D
HVDKHRRVPLLLNRKLAVLLICGLTHELLYFSNESSLVSALKTLLFFTILMVTLPIGLYFATKAYVFEGSMKMSSSDSYFYAAIVAVLAVHVVLALFVYVAWNEGTPKGKGKDD